MPTLTVITLASFVVASALGSWRLILRSTCVADHWRQEVRMGTARLKKSKLHWWPARTSGCQASRLNWPIRGQFVRNQKGSAELLTVGLLFVLTLGLTLMTLVWQRRYREVNEHLKQTLCLKKAMLETNQLVSRINKVNAVIVAGEVTSWALMFTGIGLAVKPSWENVKRALQISQNVLWLNSQRTMLSLKTQGCKLPLALWPSPYQWNGRLARGIDGRALMRTKASLWVTRTPLMVHWARWKSQSELSPTLQWEMR